MSVRRSSDTWRSVEEWASDRLRQHRAELESFGRTDAEYAALRARIAELKALLDLPTKEQ